MKDFYKTVCKIAIPVTLQCMLQSSFSIVDQLMIGKLGDNSISAVGLGGSFSMIFSVVINAVAAVGGIMISQFLGGKDKKEAWRGFSVSAVITLCIAGLFTLLALFATPLILGCYTKDSKLIAEGIPYLRIVAFTFVPMGMSVLLSTWLRCKEHAIIPLIASFLAVICNTGLNYVLIFGKFGCRAYGIEGAGIATLTSQMLNFVIILGGFFVLCFLEHEKIEFSLKLKKIGIRDYMNMILPLLFSEFLWSLGQNVCASVYGHISTASLTSYTLTGSIQGLIVGALSGISAAAGVIIGKKLGSREYDEAYVMSKKLMLLGGIGSVVLGILLICLARFYVSWFNVSEGIQNTATILLILFALYTPIKVENMILGGGILRSGGDTMTMMVIDSLGTWLVGIPLCLFTAYVLNLPIAPVYGILSVEEIVRLVVSLIIFRKRKWMMNLGENGEKRKKDMNILEESANNT